MTSSLGCDVIIAKLIFSDILWQMGNDLWSIVVQFTFLTVMVLSQSRAQNVSKMSGRGRVGRVGIPYNTPLGSKVPGSVSSEICDNFFSDLYFYMRFFATCQSSLRLSFILFFWGRGPLPGPEYWSLAYAYSDNFCSIQYFYTRFFAAF